MDTAFSICAYRCSSAANCVRPYSKPPVGILFSLDRFEAFSVQRVGLLAPLALYPIDWS
jgi:hypothetical protein